MNSARSGVSTCGELLQATHCGHSVQLVVCASNEDECTLSGRTKPNRTCQPDCTLSGAEQAALKLNRAQTLPTADPDTSDDDIAASVGVGGSTVYRTKQRSTSCSVTCRQHSVKYRVRERAESSRAKRRSPYWWQQRVPSPRMVAPVGWSY